MIYAHPCATIGMLRMCRAHGTTGKMLWHVKVKSFSNRKRVAMHVFRRHHLPPLARLRNPGRPWSMYMSAGSLGLRCWEIDHVFNRRRHRGEEVNCTSAKWWSFDTRSLLRSTLAYSENLGIQLDYIPRPETENKMGGLQFRLVFKESILIINATYVEQ